MKSAVGVLTLDVVHTLHRSVHDRYDRWDSVAFGRRTDLNLSKHAWCHRDMYSSIALELLLCFYYSFGIFEDRHVSLSL